MRNRSRLLPHETADSAQWYWFDLVSYLPVDDVPFKNSQTIEFARQILNETRPNLNQPDQSHRLYPARRRNLLHSRKLFQLSPK